MTHFSMDKKAMTTGFLKLIALPVLFVILFQITRTNGFWFTNFFLGSFWGLLVSTIFNHLRLWIKKGHITQFDNELKKSTSPPTKLELHGLIQELMNSEETNIESVQTILTYVPYLPPKGMVIHLDFPKGPSTSIDAEGLTNTGHQVNITSHEPKKQFDDGSSLVGNYKMWRWDNWLFIQDTKQKYEPDLLFSDDEEVKEMRYPPILAIKYDPATLAFKSIGMVGFETVMELAMMGHTGQSNGSCYVYVEEGENKDKIVPTELSYMFTSFKAH